MLRYAAVRLLYGVIAFFVMTIILYGLYRVHGQFALDYVPPIIPIESYWEFGNSRIHWDRDPHRGIGLGDSWVEGYFIRMGNIFEGDLGFSPGGQPVGERIMAELPSSLALGGIAGGIGVLLALGLGAIGAARPHSPLDYAGNILAAAIPATPLVLLAVLLLGPSPIYTTPLAGWGGLLAWVLPGSALSLVAMGALPFVRSAMLDQMTSEHVKLARIKGLPEWKIALKHALRVAVMGPTGRLIAGVSSFIGALIVVEIIFWRPGLGLLAFRAINDHDFMLVHAVLFFTATVPIALHVVVDIVLAFADPRIRFPEVREYAEAPATA